MNQGESTVDTVGGASPFAAAPPPRTLAEAATAEAAAEAACAAEASAVDDITSATNPAVAAAAAVVTGIAGTSSLENASRAAAAVADQAAAQLPPRASLTRADSLARAGSLPGSLTLRPLVPHNIALFGWGRNDCGQLGFAPHEGSSHCQLCRNGSSNLNSPLGAPGVIAAATRLTAFDKKNITSAAASLFNTAVITADGEVYMLGSYDSRLLGGRPKQRQQQQQDSASGSSSDSDIRLADGSSGDEDISWQPVRVEALEPYPVADVALGPEHALAVTQQGQLFTWGQGTGIGNLADKPQYTPKLVKSTAALSLQMTKALPAATAGQAGSSSVRMTYVRCAAGAGHSLALSSSGRCFSFGQGHAGALGIPGASFAPSPALMSGLWEVGVTQIAAGEAHCAALAANGTCYSWGRDKYGQLGHGSFQDEHSPKQITGVNRVKSAIAGDHHTLLLVEPQPNFGSINLLDAGGSSSSSDASYHVYACGRGTFGATGLGFEDNVCRPCIVTALLGAATVQLAAGRQHSVALTAAGQIYTWGAGELGQLGLGCTTCQQQRQQQQQQQQLDTHTGQQQPAVDTDSQTADGDATKAGCWNLPGFQLTPKPLQHTPWPPNSLVLFIAAGGDHTLAAIQLSSSAANGNNSRKRAAAAPAALSAESSLDTVIEDAAALQLPHQPAAASIVTAGTTAAGGAVTAPSVESMDTDIAVTAAGDEQPQKQQQPPLHMLQNRSGPVPDLRPHGANLVPVQPPLLLPLATAAAAEAAASGQHPGLETSGQPSAVNNRPSPVVVDLAHAVLDVFSSPGMLLQLLRAQPQQQQQQQQQRSSRSASPTPKVSATAAAVVAHGLDLDCIETTFTLLLRSYAREVVGALGAACALLLRELPSSSTWVHGSTDIVRVLFILLQNPLNSDVQGVGSILLGLLTALVLKLNGHSLQLLITWLTHLKPELFGARVIRPVQALLSRLAKDAAATAQQQQRGPGNKPLHTGLQHTRSDVLLLSRLLDVLYKANVQAGELVAYSEFANLALSNTASLHEEYFTWLHSGAYKLQLETFQRAAAKAIAAPLKKPTIGTTQQQQQETPGSGRASPAANASSLASSSTSSTSISPGGLVHCLLPGAVPGDAISSLCEVPFLLTTEAKSNILRDEAALQQQHVVHASAMAAIMQGLQQPAANTAAGAAPAPATGGGNRNGANTSTSNSSAASAAAGATPPSNVAPGQGPQVIEIPISRDAGDPLSLVLSLRVRRDHVMEDALRQIRRCGPQELKKPLRVTFLSEDGKVAEAGVDQGGVSREFFQLLVAQLFNPDYGMFVYMEESRVCWFNHASLESLDEFELVGNVLGLACYNGMIIDAHLPLVAYKKLMGVATDFADLAGLFPGLHMGLQQLLDFSGDVENTFCRTFEVDFEVFGQVQQHELLPGGSQTPVTADNRQQFVELYSDWLINGSVAEQFAAFASGFHRVCGGPALSLFRYEEVELLVEGLPHLNFHQLQAGARYEAGYSDRHPTIQALWSVLLGLSIDDKRAFLQFCTGCDRAPVAGLAALRLLVQRAGPDSEKLPTAHTCFNTLLLPEYSSKAKLQQKLMTAISNAQGFGLQ